MVGPSDYTLNLPFNLKESWRRYRLEGHNPKSFSERYRTAFFVVMQWVQRMEREESAAVAERAAQYANPPHVTKLLLHLMGMFSLRDYAQFTGLSYIKLYRVLKGESELNLSEQMALINYHGLTLNEFDPRTSTLFPANVSHLTNRNDIV